MLLHHKRQQSPLRNSAALVPPGVRWECSDQSANVEIESGKSPIASDHRVTEHKQDDRIVPVASTPRRTTKRDSLSLCNVRCTYRVDTIRSIGCGNDGHSFQLLDSIHLDQKSGNDTIADIRLTRSREKKCNQWLSEEIRTNSMSWTEHWQ